MILPVAAFVPWDDDTGIHASSTIEWSVPMTVSAGSQGINNALKFGVRELATDGLDSGVDVLHPPPSPGATFDAYFDISATTPILNRLDEDYRGPANIIEWSLDAQCFSEDITLTWDAMEIPSGYSAQMNTGIGIIDMLSRNTLPSPLPAGQHTIIISIQEEEDTTPPVIIGTLPSNGATNVPISAVVTATFDEEINEATLVFSLDSVPGTVTYDNISFTATYTPFATLDYSATYIAGISASDLSGNPMPATHIWSFTTVGEANKPPQLAPIGDQVLDEGSTLNVPVSAIDPDGDPISLSALGIPLFASFIDNGNGSGILTLAPGLDDSGIYPNVEITASDGDLTDNETITITVEEVEAPYTVHTWTFNAAGCYPKHLPDAYFGQVVLSNLDTGTMSDVVQGVYWYNGDEWLFWAPYAPGCTLSTLGGGHTFDYLVCVTGPCEWELILP